MPKTMSDTLGVLEGSLGDLFQSLRAYLLARGDDTSYEVLKRYVGFRRRQRNFARVKIRPGAGKVLVLLPDAVNTDEALSLDIRYERHYGGEWQVTLRSQGDLERIVPLLQASYDIS